MSGNPALVTLAIMAKQPSPGRTKTRLVPTLGPAAAAELAHCFLLDAIGQVRSVAAADRHVVPAIAAAPAGSEAFFSQLAPEFEIIAQHGDDLGHRLDHVLTTALASTDFAIAINSDSPTLPTRLLEQAVRAVREPDIDVVFGPADDGGYYLIAVSRPPAELVTSIEMSTPNVLADSLAVAATLGLRVRCMEPWYDVDEPADLARLRADLAGAAAGLHTRRFLGLP